MARTIGGVIAGLVIALAAMMGVSWVNQLLYPALKVPLGNVERMGEAMLALPVGAQVIIAAAWLVGALVGGWVAGAISKRSWPVWLIAGAVALLAIANVLAISHPMLLKIMALVAPLVGGALANALLRRTPSAGMGAPA
jgi:hypothetical protein